MKSDNCQKGLLNPLCFSPLSCLILGAILYIKSARFKLLLRRSCLQGEPRLSFCNDKCILNFLGPSRGYEEQGNLQFSLMGTWEHEQIFQFFKNLGRKWVLQFGTSFRGTVKNVFVNKGDFRNFSREQGNTDSSGKPTFS